MKNITTKIVVLITAFLMVTITIAFFTQQQTKKYQPIPTYEPHFFCGTKNVEEHDSPGNDLFKANCAACHKLSKRAVGPALSGITKTEGYPSEAYFYEFIRNQQELINRKDKHALASKATYGNSDFIHAFNFTDEEIAFVLDYISFLN